MKNNKKVIDLIKKGFSIKTLSSLSESQINVLHSKLISEQEQPIKKTIEITTLRPGATQKIGNFTVSNDKGNTTITPTSEEIQEDMVDMNVSKEPNTNEGKKKKKNSPKQVPNPWAICHAQLGPKKTRKFERCVKEVKKSLAEGKNPVSLFLESQIMKIVEKNIPPRITKGDLLKYLSEDTKTAPAEPKTAPAEPKTKPDKGKPKKRPSHPGKNPNPGENPAPKAISPERAKDEVINAIMKMLEQ